MTINKYLLMLAIGSGFVHVSKVSADGPWPTSVADNVTLTASQRVYLPVLDNDIGDELTIFDVNTTTAELGSVEIGSDNKGVYYQSGSDFVGDDSFWYAFEDDEGRTNAAQVFVKVIEAEPIEEPEEPETPEDPYIGWPVATLDLVTTLQDEAVTIPVLENDIGLDLTLTAINEVTVSNGSATIQDDKIIYTPYQGFIGEDSFWYQFTDARGRANSTQVKVTVNEEAVVPPVEPPEPETPAPEITFNHVDMHYKLLQGQSQIYGEVTGTSYYMSLAESASAGSTSLLLGGDYDVKDGQLLTYLGTNGEYYTVAVDTLNERVLRLKQPLKADVENNIWNFYQDGAHPHWYGYLSVADFAIRELNLETLDSGKHLLLGDSWFQSDAIENRLTERLSNAEFINKGVGGRTAANILAEFDTDIAGVSPDFVWVIVGTNDYFQEVSLESYLESMKAIIAKINDSGAQAIIINSSVAPLMYGSDELTELSHSYATAIGELLVSEN